MKQKINKLVLVVAILAVMVAGAAEGRITPTR